MLTDCWTSQVKTDMNGGLEGPAAITVEDSVEQT